MTIAAGSVILAADVADLADDELDSLKITTAATYYNSVAEAVITSASVSGQLRNGKRYAVIASVPVSSAAGATGTFAVKVRLRKTNAAGAELDGGQKQEHIPAAQFGQRAVLMGFYDCTGDESPTFVATAERTSGASANAVVAVNATNGALLMRLIELPDTSPRTI